MMKYKLISINILIWIVIIFSLSYTSNLHASTLINNDNDVVSKFRKLHAKYDYKFSQDGNWASSSRGDYDIYELNFSRWLIKNGHGGELISDNMFDKNSQQYYKSISTWHTLLQTGELIRFGDAVGDYPIALETNGITNISHLQPIRWDGKLQNYVDHTSKNANGVSLLEKDNRVNLLIHNPSLERDVLRRYSGQDAYYTEVLASKSRSIESQILSYIMDDHNISLGNENGHRFVILSNNEYAASAHTSNGSNIMAFSNENQRYNFDTLNQNYVVRKKIAEAYKDNKLTRVHYIYRVDAGDNAQLINVPLIGYSNFLKPEQEKKYYAVGKEITIDGDKYEIEKIVKFADEDIDLLPYGDFIKVRKLTNPRDGYNQTSSSAHYHGYGDDARVVNGVVWFNGKNRFVLNGNIKTGLINYRGNKYYVNTRTTELMKNWQLINNKLYYFGSNGQGYNKIRNGHWYYFKTGRVLRKTFKMNNGAYAKSQTIKISRWHYKFDKHGYMYKRY